MTKYESKRGKYRVEVSDGKPVIEIYGSPSSLPVQSVDDLKDLFIVIASVLNQIYDNDN